MSTNSENKTLTSAPAPAPANANANANAPLKRGQSMLSKRRYRQIEEKFKEILVTDNREENDGVLLDKLLTEFREIMQFDPEGLTYGARDKEKQCEYHRNRNIAIKDLATMVRSKLKDESHY
jgi:hypothetical protein